jgi:hypothetical protein
VVAVYLNAHSSNNGQEQAIKQLIALGVTLAVAVVSGQQ